MLKKKIIRLFYNLINPFRRAYWFIFRPKTKGVKCVIECNGQVLFVRLGYAHKSWTIPGGGVKRGESWEDAAKREVREEVGITLIGSLEKIGEYVNTSQYKVDTVWVFYARVETADFKIDGTEIAAAQWADPSAPPQPCMPRVKLLIEYMNKRKNEQK